MAFREDDLCAAFADALVDNPDFRLWILDRTPFAGVAQQARLLDGEQMAIRPRKRWWRHWWCHVPALTHQRETDIFCVFEAGDMRFALHIENKLGAGAFLPGQAEGYRPRADYMSGQARFLNYGKSATLLLAPKAFVARCPADCALFDGVLFHEDIAAFIPEFGTP